MLNIITEMTWWHWIVLGVVLAAIETFVPGGVAMWFALSAGIVGLSLLVFPMPWQWQWVLFAVLGIVTLLLFRKHFLRHPTVSDQPQLNQRAQQYIGQILILIEPIEEGYGKVRVGDGVWKVVGPELPSGSKVKVVSADGTILKVEAA